VSFTVMLAHYYPQLMWLVLPFAVSVAVSRVVLGLHYPTDVLAGGLLGWVLAAASLELVPF
jgi:undecaprenyl-diphosphatase